jgi:2-amino-4-hydroxy-6-hydroxymethyldihydropteridine diphosphokinase
VESGSGNERGGEWEGAVVVALGGNVGGVCGSSSAVLEQALSRFPEIGLQVRRRSSLWRSAAWPDPTEPDYINAVALVETSLGASRTLKALQGLERAFGRTRGRPNAPRTLDLDLIAYGRLTSTAGDLVLPHPRAAERLFVMGPLAEIAPDWRHPLSGRSARDLALQASVGCDATPLGEPTMASKAG